jgi:phage gp36-like protein
VSLTDRNYTGQIDDDVLNGALVQASAEIDGYLCGRYPVPWADEPRVLVGRCCNIARYLLCGSETQMTAKSASGMKTPFATWKKLHPGESIWAARRRVKW